MVNKQMVGNPAYLTVHKYLTLFSIFVFNMAGGVKIPALFDCVPFVFRQPSVIVGIDYCVFTLCQRYPAEGVAVAQPPVQKHRQSKQPYEPERYGYGKLYDTPSAV